MKIKSIQISNILSFKHFEDITHAPIINFDQDFSILIGQNGSGKSTVLEIINFIFRRVLFIPYDRNRDLYGKRTTIDVAQKKGILAKADNTQNYRGFRLERNYDFEDKPQQIRVIVELDAIDQANIKYLQENKDNLAPVIDLYSAEKMFDEGTFQSEYQIDIFLDSTSETYTIKTTQDIGYTYLSAYNLYKEVIELYNEENPKKKINNLAESFALIGSYRNYSMYSPHASLGGGNTAPKQIQQVRISEYSKSTNAAESGEPTVFSIVRLRMAEACFNLIGTKKDKNECEVTASKLPFIIAINEKLKIVNVRVEIKLVDLSSWNFAFSFVDIKRKRNIEDINSLSAGQKAIIHLVFEAYGRGDLKGGLVIIDEPEIHLHYQFQNDYLRVIEKLNVEQGCQYILVTHSESLINSTTIENVIRLSLCDQSYTNVHQPRVTVDQKWLVKILDNTRSTHAFFGSKVLLVEGEDDRYFFRALLGEIEENIKVGVTQDITVLDIEGKNNPDLWKDLFGAFGLKIYFISDLDASYGLFYPAETAIKIKDDQARKDFLAAHPDNSKKIETAYADNVYILKEGNLEIYLNIHNKGLSEVIKFCNNALKNFLKESTNSKVIELKKIMSDITGENESKLW
ncbi:AAA family ATPase [candidate division WWE3 bacterium]|jgi:predicted ATP-dependent endonuclease of OLD family|nr:AAA family ATPase [candidate division WWE3 bacterium]MBT7349316.1 AAA family ATPase [candidate division WWE3 bacterium]